MKKSSIFTVQFKRKRNGSTNYRKRLNILSANKPRFVVRKSLRNIQAAIVEYHQKGDKIQVSSHSSQLKKFGWSFGTGNLPAAYLVGYLLGKRAEKFKDAVFDVGLTKPIGGSKVYAVLAGALDAGLNVPHSKDILPIKDRISGKHIADYADMLKKDDNMLKKQFGEYLKNDHDRLNIIKNFEEVKSNIDKNK